jgi:TPR repeat protein
MEDTSRLNSARRHLHEGRVADGIRECVELSDQGSAEAPDYLGIIYLSGLGAHKDVVKAKNYFLLSHTRGYALGTYHLAGVYHGESNITAALELYKLVADKNPSAAYWIFRCLEKLAPCQKELENESEKYLMQAVKLGHIEALRALAIRTIKGRYGLRKVPDGISKFLGIVEATEESIRKRERLKYIDSLHRWGFRLFYKPNRQPKQ